jgi:hypothetical protein
VRVHDINESVQFNFPFPDVRGGSVVYCDMNNGIQGDGEVGLERSQTAKPVC